MFRNYPDENTNAYLLRSHTGVPRKHLQLEVQNRCPLLYLQRVVMLTEASQRECALSCLYPFKTPKTDMGVSKNWGPQNRPQYIMILLMRTPKEGPLIFGTPHMVPWHPSSYGESGLSEDQPRSPRRPAQELPCKSGVTLERHREEKPQHRKPL